MFRVLYLAPVTESGARRCARCSSISGDLLAPSALPGADEPAPQSSLSVAFSSRQEIDRGVDAVRAVERKVYFWHQTQIPPLSFRCRHVRFSLRSLRTRSLTPSTTRNLDRQREQLEAFTKQKPLSDNAVKEITEAAKGKFYRKYLKVKSDVGVRTDGYRRTSGTTPSLKLGPCFLWRSVYPLLFPRNNQTIRRDADAVRFLDISTVEWGNIAGYSVVRTQRLVTVRLPLFPSVRLPAAVSYARVGNNRTMPTSARLSEQATERACGSVFSSAGYFCCSSLVQTRPIANSANMRVCEQGTDTCAHQSPIQHRGLRHRAACPTSTGFS